MIIVASYSISQSLATISIIVGLLGIGAAMYAYSRYKSDIKRFDVQNENIAALKSLLETHEDQIKELTSQVAALKSRNEVVETLPLKDIFSELGAIKAIVSKGI